MSEMSRPDPRGSEDILPALHPELTLSAPWPVNDAEETELLEGTAEGEIVQSLDRGLSVIRAFGHGRSKLTLTEVATATGLTRAAARRFLLTLAKLGYVRMEGRQFSLRPSVLELGYAYLSGLALPEIAAPHLERLVAEVRESSSISILDGHDIVYVARVPTKRIMRIGISVGTRFPAYATSMGRVLLGGLPDLEKYLADVQLEPITRSTVTNRDVLREMIVEARMRGYAIVDEELEEGLRSVAVPIIGADGEIIAAVNVAAHASVFSMSTMRTTVLSAVSDAARHIEEDLRTFGILKRKG